jgi:hypothetical protein
MDYFAYPGVPGRYFHCAAHKANLSDTRCAAMYGEAKTLKIGSCMPLEKCIGCPVGALHSGDTAPQKVVRAIGSLTCARCHQPAPRLVCGGICVSCKNRELEIAKGRNAKGVPPRPIDRFWDDEATDGKTLVTHHVELTVAVAGRVRNIAFDHVADTLEAVLRSLRNVRDEVVFSRRFARIDNDMALFAGSFRQKAKRRSPIKKDKTSFLDQPSQLLLWECL